MLGVGLMIGGGVFASHDGLFSRRSTRRPFSRFLAEQQRSHIVTHHSVVAPFQRLACVYGVSTVHRLHCNNICDAHVLFVVFSIVSLFGFSLVSFI
jgi:hypothetical protein